MEVEEGEVVVVAVVEAEQEGVRKRMVVAAPLLLDPGNFLGL